MKMIRVGIVGAENSHAAAIAGELNVKQTFPGFSVTHVWGETDAFAKATAEAGQIPTIVKRPGDMIGQVDGVMIDHRNGKFHVPAARPFLDARVPIFIDKPLSTSLAQARTFLEQRRQKRVPVTTMSAVPHQAAVADIRKAIEGLGELRTLHLAGPGDVASPYGGVFFYGIHQADLLVELLGTGAVEVTGAVNGGTFTATVAFPGDVMATLSMGGGLKGWTVSAVGTGGSCQLPVTPDSNMYHATTRRFTEMFRTGQEPFGDDRMLAPIAMLEAMRKAIERGGCVKVGQLA